MYGCKRRLNVVVVPGFTEMQNLNPWASSPSTTANGIGTDGIVPNARLVLHISP